MRICGARIGLRPAWFLFLLLTVLYLQIFSSLSLAATSFTITNLTANNPVTAGYTAIQQHSGERFRPGSFYWRQ